MENLIEIKNVSKIYESKPNLFSNNIIRTNALNNVSFNIKSGEIKGLVGESGSGKTTLGKLILKLDNASSGEILYKGENISNFNKKETKNFRHHCQMIFQNPYSSLNPKMKIFDILKEPITIFGYKKDIKNRILEIIHSCGLSENDLNRYPHEFSGGQRQRIAIARALILNPEFIVADEPVSALDISIQAQIINLLNNLKNEFNLTYLFISHDLNVVSYLCDNVVILNNGKIEEEGDIESVFTNPKTEYSKKLISSIPKIKL